MSYQFYHIRRMFEIRDIVTVHYFEYSSSYSFAGESHNFWEFVYVDKGEIEVRAGEDTLTLQKGEIIFHQPGEFHSLWANGVVAPNLVVAAFDCQSPAMSFFEHRKMLIGNRGRELIARVVEEAKAAFSSQLDDPLLQSLEAREGADPGCEQMIALSLEEFLIHLYRTGTSGVQEVPTNLIRTRSIDSFLEKVTQYFEENIDKRLTLEDVCRETLMGRSYVQKIFHSATGGGAMEYFGVMKVHKAQELIRAGHYNFTEIAELLGYTSIHYFSRHFKKVTGMTPTEYASSVKALDAKDGK